MGTAFVALSLSLKKILSSLWNWRLKSLKMYIFRPYQNFLNSVLTPTVWLNAIITDEIQSNGGSYFPEIICYFVVTQLFWAVFCNLPLKFFFSLYKLFEILAFGTHFFPSDFHFFLGINNNMKNFWNSFC